MADVNSAINMTEFSEELSRYILDKFSPLITIFKILGIVILVYFIFLLIKALFRWKTSRDMGKIARNVEEINAKLDILIKKPRVKSETEKEEKEKNIKKKQ